MPGPVIDLHVYDDETQLLHGLRRREADACTCFVKRYAPMVYGRALRLLGDADEAEGVLQQTFIKACERFQDFAGESSMGTWLYRIATNEALMRLRRRRPQVEIDSLAEVLDADQSPQPTVARPPDPASAALGGELRTAIDAALAALPETLRVVFVLREIDGLSTEETARQLGLGESAVKVRLHRARQRLRALLAAYVDDATEPTDER